MYKLTLITKGVKYTSEWLANMIIRDDIISVEKKVFIKMLCNWEAVLAQDFSKIGKVKKEVAIS